MYKIKLGEVWEENIAILWIESEATLKYCCVVVACLPACKCMHGDTEKLENKWNDRNKGHSK